MIYAKMNGLGNQFIVLDARTHSFVLNEAKIQKLCDYKNGIGCDQLLILENSNKCDVFMRIYNNDGSKVAACGNGTRAIGWLIAKEKGKADISIETEAGILNSHFDGGMKVSVNMGKPRLKWNEIPLSEEMDTIRIGIQLGPIDNPVLWGPGCVSMGNPHCVFFVENAETAPVKEVGPMIENHPWFPERANVGFAQIIDKETIRLRVWERGAGLTKACGTGACAALVAANRRKLVGRFAKLILDGGELFINWREDGDVIMSGEIEYEGEFQSDLI